MTTTSRTNSTKTAPLSKPSKSASSLSGLTTPPKTFRIAIMRSGNTVICEGGRTTTWQSFLKSSLTPSQLAEFSTISGKRAARKWLKSRMAEQGIWLATPSRNSYQLTTGDYEAINNPSFEPAVRSHLSGLPSYRFWSIIILRARLKGCAKSAEILSVHSERTGTLSLLQNIFSTKPGQSLASRSCIGIERKRTQTTSNISPRRKLNNAPKPPKSSRIA